MAYVGPQCGLLQGKVKVAIKDTSGLERTLCKGVERTGDDDTLSSFDLG